jgi:hypothetical protein
MIACADIGAICARATMHDAQESLPRFGSCAHEIGGLLRQLHVNHQELLLASRVLTAAAGID